MTYKCPICDIGKRLVGDMKLHIYDQHEGVDWKIKWIYEK